MEVRRFAIKLILIAVLMAGISFYPLWLWLGSLALILIYSAFLLSCATGIASFFITFHGLKKDVRFFTTYLLGGMFVKFFTGIFSITVVGLAVKEFGVHFALSYFFAFAVSTALEVATLMPLARK